MDARRVAVIAATAIFLTMGVIGSRAADTPNFAGRWTLNKTLTRIPDDIGFGMDLIGPADDPAGRGEPGRNPAVLFRESADDAARREHLVNEVRQPPEELRITQTEESVIVAADRGQPRTFYLDGREAMQKLGLVSVASTARWSASKLEVRYKVEQNREVRYEYARTSDPSRITVEVRFVERGGHDTATLVYEPAREGAPPPAAPPAAPAPPPAAFPPTLGGLGQAGRGGLSQPPGRSAPPQAAPPQQQEPAPGAVGPDAPLAGIVRVGMVVEELRPQAAACGLTQASIETMVSKAFTDAGIKVLKDSDEDTYVYVDIGTTSASAGFCVSRYDVYLMTNTMARLSHQSAPVLVQVQLLHQGGLSGGAPAAHGEAVRKNVKQAADEFAARIKAASK
jgi:hypothetical protein